MLLCTSIGGELKYFPNELLTKDIEEGMAVIRGKDGRFKKYDGAYQDHNGEWWHLVYESGTYHLAPRRPPLTDDELQVFLEQLISAGDADLLPEIYMTTGDLIRAGKTKLAAILLSRAALLDDTGTVEASLALINDLQSSPNPGII